MNKYIQFRGLLSREVMRFLKVPLQTIGAPMINTFLYILIFGVSLGRSIELKGNTSYLEFLIPGLVAMSIIKNSFDNATSSIMGQKYVNELQDLRTAPFSILQLSFSRSLASLLRGLIVGLITLFIGEIFYVVIFHAFIGIHNPISLLFFSVVGGLCFGFLGTTIGMYSKSFEHVGAISSMVLLPLIYLGGVFFNINNLDPFWRYLSYFNPLYYLIDGIRYSFLGNGESSILISAATAFFFLVFVYLLSIHSLKRGSNYFR